MPKINLTNVTAVSLSAALLLGPVTGMAYADDASADSSSPKPPAAMSTTGGDALGRPGTQMQPGAGTPALPKNLTGRSWIISDAESGDVLAAHNAHWKLPPASTLKMLFADTLLPKLSKTAEHKVAPEDLKGMPPDASQVGVKEGETYTVGDLWLGVFLRSGNDAVHVLSQMYGGKEQTVADMQAKAKDMQANDTHVVEPDGYDAPGQTSSAYDLSLFGREGMTNADFREYAATATARFPGKTKKGKRSTFAIQNTNRLLTGDYGIKVYKGIAGIKNGYTSKAGNTFTGIAERSGKVLLVTVMHPKPGHDRVYQEAGQLLDWGFKSASTVSPVGKLLRPKSTLQNAKNPGASASPKSRHDAVPAASARKKSSGGVTTALSITAGSLAVLALLAFVVNRR